jgi:hypothetical protein
MEGANSDNDSTTLPALLASVTVCPEGIERCTIYSSDSPHRHRAEMWLSASGDSFVALAEMC